MEHNLHFSSADVLSANENRLTNNSTFQLQWICTLDEEKKSVEISTEVDFWYKNI